MLDLKCCASRCIITICLNIYDLFKAALRSIPICQLTQLLSRNSQSAMHPDLHCESLCCGNDPYGVTSHSSGSKTASHQSFAVLVDEVFRGLGPFGQNNIIYSFLGDLQATQIKSCKDNENKA